VDKFYSMGFSNFKLIPSKLISNILVSNIESVTK